MTKNEYELIIIGGGPAGSTLASLVGNKFKTLIIDRRDLTSKTENKQIKSCGGLLAPAAQKALASLGVNLDLKVLTQPQSYSVEVIDFDTGINISYPKHYLNINREEFDRLLFKRTESISDFCCGIFKSAKKTDNGYEVNISINGEVKTITTKILIGADGANSKIRTTFFKDEPFPKKYTSIQEWFEFDSLQNTYAAFFDKEITDFYSWVIPKENYLIFGSAIPSAGGNISNLHNLQKQKLSNYGFDFSKSCRREGAAIFRPLKLSQICAGKETIKNIALIGEAAGFINPSSAEGISYALLSGKALANALNNNPDDFLNEYNKNCISLKKSIFVKNIKNKLMYNQFARKIIFKSKFGTVAN